MSEGIRILEHPVYPLPSREQYEADPQGAQAYMLGRNERIELEVEVLTWIQCIAKELRKAAQ